MEFEKKSDTDAELLLSYVAEHSTTREVRSEELFRGSKTVIISHANVQYRLLITRNNKLILQK